MRALARLVFTLILLAIALAVGYYFGYRAAAGHGPSLVGSVVGTSGSKAAGEAGTAIERSLAQAGSEATAFFSDTALTTKITSKMSLDDHVEARNIRVSTSGGVVTLSGTARSSEERARAVALARDTKGVKSVIDKITVR
jgi:hyperosmotically inducible protein